MELRHLRYFVAVAEHLHFGRAAAQLRVAQPSLSHQIQQLERELQTQLLLRTKRQVQLTDAGRLFLEEARDILARADRAAVMARSASTGTSATLRVGIGYCMDHLTVITAISSFAKRRPDVRVALQTQAVSLQLAALRDGRLDIGFVRPPVSDPALHGEMLFNEPLCVALPVGHAHARRKAVGLTAIAKDPLVVVPRDLAPVYHDLIIKACRTAGFVPNVRHEADHVQAILGIVAKSHCVALVPASAVRVKSRGSVVRPLHGIAPSLDTAIAWRRDKLTESLGIFLDVVRAAARRSRFRGR